MSSSTKNLDLPNLSGIEDLFSIEEKINFTMNGFPQEMDTEMREKARLWTISTRKRLYTVLLQEHDGDENAALEDDRFDKTFARMRDFIDPPKKPVFIDRLGKGRPKFGEDGKPVSSKYL